MFISKIQLDPKKRETAKALQDRSILHAALESTIEGERPHILWRLEPDRSILAVSRDIPYLGDMQNRFGNGATRPETKAYDDYINTIEDGNRMRFVITVNPVINKADGSKNGKDVPLNLRRTSRFPLCAEDWIRSKLNENGASVREIRDIEHNTAYFNKSGCRIPIFTVTYSGIFHVDHADLLRNAMITGIGGKKTYGCGLLTAVRIHE